MANEAFKAGEGALWIQPNGPNTAPQYLGCHMVGDIAVPKGDTTLLYCPDESASGKFKVDGSFRSAPGPVTTTITTKVYSVADYLEGLNCPVSIFIVKQKCGRRDVFPNYDRIWALSDALVTNETLTAMLAMSPEDEGESQQAYDLSALALLKFWKVIGARQSTTETEGINDLVFIGEESCASGCGEAVAGCAVGFAVTDALAGSAANTADVLYTADGGGTWTATATKPFAGGMDIAVVVLFAKSSTVNRVLVGNGTTRAGAPAQIAYSDNEGTTWTQVNVGSTNTQYFMGPQSIFALNLYNIWAVVSGGYIYQSQDSGVTWTTRDAGVASGADDLFGVHFTNAQYGAAVGETNTILRTSDSGVTWSAITGPAAQNAVNAVAVSMVDKHKVWVGYSDGKLYYTTNFQDATPTWTLRSTGITASDIKDIQFYDALTGYIAADVAGPIGHVLRTWDGGYTWEDISFPTNSGLTSLHVCGPNKAYVGGNIDTATGFIAKVA